MHRTSLINISKKINKLRSTTNTSHISKLKAYKNVTLAQIKYNIKHMNITTITTYMSTIEISNDTFNQHIKSIHNLKHNILTQVQLRTNKSQFYFSYLQKADASHIPSY